MTLRKGDAVRISYQGCTLDGRVIMVSPNGTALAVEYHGTLGPFFGSIALLRDEQGALWPVFGPRVAVDVRPI